MKILLQWEIPLNQRELLYKEFAAMELSDYEAQWDVPGVTKIGSWHNAATGKALAIVETENPNLVADLVLSWNSLAEVEMSVVFDDAETHAQARRHASAPGPLGESNTA